ncbi:MAG TPA: hypothetical protein VEG61_08010 [Candidatus Dormibacteraeota bacterium]|nr:hypothetical protein [Candidatus Dormibacteraeota bacterium]
MKFIDIAFGATLVAFGLGSIAGALVTLLSSTFREFLLFLINSRVITPVRTAFSLGPVAAVLLIFFNNCIPVALSFLYPLILGKVRWTPPIRKAIMIRLLAAFSLLTGTLLGFFNLGATLALVAELRGLSTVNGLLATSLVHAPLEFLFILACGSEPLRLAVRRVRGDEIVRLLREDTSLLFISLVGLLASAAIEVFAHL